jgi:hypothetical protein
MSKGVKQSFQLSIRDEKLMGDLAQPFHNFVKKVVFAPLFYNSVRLREKS